MAAQIDEESKPVSFFFFMKEIRLALNYKKIKKKNPSIILK